MVRCFVIIFIWILFLFCLFLFVSWRLVVLWVLCVYLVCLCWWLVNVLFVLNRIWVFGCFNVLFVVCILLMKVNYCCSVVGVYWMSFLKYRWIWCSDSMFLVGCCVLVCLLLVIVFCCWCCLVFSNVICRCSWNWILMIVLLMWLVKVWM